MQYTLLPLEFSRDSYNVTSSGGYNDDGTYTGDHDIREGFLSKLRGLESVFEFVRWRGDHHLWIIDYSETKDDYDSDAINNERVALFPEKVKDVIKDKFYGAEQTIPKIENNLMKIFFNRDKETSKYYQYKWIDELDYTMSLEDVKDFFKDHYNMVRLVKAYMLLQKAINKKESNGN